MPFWTSIPDAAESGGGSPTIWLVALAAAVFAGVALLRFRPRGVARGGRPGSFADAGELARAELERLVVEIQDLSREHIARLDAKIRLLSQLLAECDRKQKEIESLLGRTSPSAPARTEAVPSAARAPNPLHEQVYTLRDAGKDLLEICSATGLEKGEVELILGLRQVPPAGLGAP
ncbi:MAG TPA: hypothetical protein VNO22_08855 [Planctomycetota bacterium]|jgi:hypothetical protein|nr:hypothetical protein [Planctomycetota bacterium]